MTRTAGQDLESEAATHSQGSPYRAWCLAKDYKSYANRCEEDGRTPDDFQSWAESEHPEISGEKPETGAAIDYGSKP